jgi:hypothetical protein
MANHLQSIVRSANSVVGLVAPTSYSLPLPGSHADATGSEALPTDLADQHDHYLYGPKRTLPMKHPVADTSF